MYGIPMRIGILYRNSNLIKSIRCPTWSMDSEWPEGTVSEIREELERRKGQQRDYVWDEDNSYLSYFYRCLEEGTEIYVLYEAGVGWKAGGTTWDTALRGKLLPWQEAIEILERWFEDLKYTISQKE